MRRSTLQRKDRSELNQIANALGAKPPSRARKDEIIQLIIDLTSGGPKPTQPSNGGPPQGPPSAAERAPRRPARFDIERRRTTGPQARANAQAARGTNGQTNNPRRGVRPGPPPARSTVAKSANVEQTRTSTSVEPGNRRKRRRTRDRDGDKPDNWDGDSVPVSGRLDLRDEGYGFLRVNGCLPDRNDAYVPVKTIRQYGLRRGDHLTGTSRPANRTEKNPALLRLDSINEGPAELTERPLFEQMTPIHAARQLCLEQPDNPDALTARMIDLVAPIGVGQRVLVKAPLHAGASELLAEVIAGIEANEPDIYVMGLMINQRPEDATEFGRLVRHGEVAATTFDQSPEDHTHTAEMTIERAKRLVESGRDVAVVLDGITSLARAYNAALSNAGRAFTGNVESGAVQMPKKLFSAARNVVGGGSLTMIAIVRSGRSDAVQRAVYGEFEGTANAEISLDRWAKQLGLIPAIDIAASHSYDEHRFLDERRVQALNELRQSCINQGGEGPGATVATLEAARERLARSATNSQLVG